MADVKPADVYVGVVELFSVLLPGAFLTGALVVAAQVDPDAFRPLLNEPETQWVAFALVAYALGAIAFSFAAEIDALYNGYRARKWPDEPRDAYNRATTLRAQFFEVGRLGPRRAAKDIGPWLRAFLLVVALLAWVEPLKRDKPVAVASGGSAPAAPTAAKLVDQDDPMNTFTWAKTLLSLRAPAALADVQRYEAESKFFRSLLVVLPLVSVLGVFHWVRIGEPALAAGAAVLPVLLVPLCFRRFAEQRRKSTSWAYCYVITYLQAEMKLKPTPESAPKGIAGPARPRK